MELFYITNNPIEAKIAERSGVDWIFVDLEKHGKEKRQKGLDTVKSNHSLNDIHVITNILTTSKCLVRCNPIGPWSKAELQQINSINKVDMVMLPFFKTTYDVEYFINNLDTSKVKPCLLFETVESIEKMNQILDVFPFEYVHIGLNDLNIQRRTKNLFLPFIDGTLEHISMITKLKNVRFGIGGIAPINSNLTPSPKLLLIEHLGLGSTGVILSRTFKGNFESRISNITFQGNLTDKINELRNFISKSKFDAKELIKNKILLSQQLKEL